LDWESENTKFSGRPRMPSLAFTTVCKAESPSRAAVPAKALFPVNGATTSTSKGSAAAASRPNPGIRPIASAKTASRTTRIA
jgi:hypothetical protein